MIYEITFGIDLCILEIYAQFNKEASKEKKINSKKIIKLYKKLIKAEKIVIDEGMLSIKRFGISKYWNYYLNKYVKQDSKKGKKLLNELMSDK